MESKYYFRCITCGREYPAEPFLYLCPDCENLNNENNPPGGILKTVYDYDQIVAEHKGEDLFHALSKSGFLELLPISRLENLSPLRVGNTPLYRYDNPDRSDLGHELFLKDDSQNPTFSYKDRASNLVCAYAKEKGIDTIVAASTGNAGSSLAGICASLGQQAIIMAPASAPRAKLVQICMYGATLIPVDGSYDQAFELSLKASKKFGWFNRNTAYNPFTIEGKKTASFEIYQQMNGRLPERIFVPVGDGVIISGIYKGFDDLKQLGIIDRIPLIIAVQAQGSDNIISNLHNIEFRSRPSMTIADSISVDVPRNFFMARDYIISNHGEGLSVSDDEILSASRELAESTGIFAEPAAAAAFAGYRKYRNLNKIEPGSSSLVILTGSGLKDIQAVKNIISLPDPITPEMRVLERSGLIKP